MFYIIDNNNIMIAGNEKALIDYSCEIKKLPEDYEEGKYIVVDGELVLNPEWEEEQAGKERKRLDNLSLTPSDVERALYKAKGMDFEDLKTLIAEKAPQLDMKALAIEFRANNFYRGVVVNGIRLIDTVGALLGYTSADMNYLFENKELPVKENENE